MALASLLYVVARRQRWTLWAAVRVMVNLALGLGIGLIALVGNTATTKITPQIVANYGNKEQGELSSDHTPYSTLTNSPGVLPVLLGVYLVILTLNHVTGDGLHFSFFKSSKSRTRPTKILQEAL